MILEQWWKIWCPNCNAVNWLNNGDPSDMTAFDVQAFKCHACGKVSAMSDDDEFDEDDADWAEEGLPKP
jgi:phage FluMu protein Com